MLFVIKSRMLKYFLDSSVNKSVHWSPALPHAKGAFCGESVSSGEDYMDTDSDKSPLKTADISRGMFKIEYDIFDGVVTKRYWNVYSVNWYLQCF